MVNERARERRPVWSAIWTAIAWFALLRASAVQWTTSADSLPHDVRIATAYAVVVVILAYAVHVRGARLRVVPATIVLNLHIVAVEWLHFAKATPPPVAHIVWSFAGIALGAILVAALDSAPLRPPRAP